MTDSVNSSIAPRADNLHWWAAAAGVAVVTAPLPDGWGLTARVAALLLGIVALCLARNRTARLIAALTVVVVGVVVGLEVSGRVAAILVERSFTDDAVVIG